MKAGTRCAVALLGLLLIAVSASAKKIDVSQVHLGWSTSNVYETMTVVWYSSGAEPYSVVYDGSSHPGSGNASPYPESQPGDAYTIQPTVASDGSAISTTPFAGTYYRAELVGLDAGHTYYFRIRNDMTGETSQEWSFRTIALVQEVCFTFAGDSQRPYTTPDGVPLGQLRNVPAAPANWPDMRDFITEAAAQRDPDFMLGLGDFVSRGNAQEQWTHWFSAWEKLARGHGNRLIPIVPVIGNHDTGGYPDVDASYEWFLGLFAVPQPLPGLPCYALDFPNLHLTVLGATCGQTATDSGKAQLEAQLQAGWLEQDLLGSAATWRIVAFHYNYMGCFAPCTGYASDVYMEAWTPILEDNDVDMVLMGHSHNYTRSWPLDLAYDGTCLGPDCGVDLTTHSQDGITYVTAGVWGAPASPIKAGSPCQLRDWIAAAAGHPGFGIVTANDIELAVAMTDTSGNFLDLFELPYSATGLPMPAYTEMVP